MIQWTRRCSNCGPLLSWHGPRCIDLSMQPQPDPSPQRVGRALLLFFGSRAICYDPRLKKPGRASSLPVKVCSADGSCSQVCIFSYVHTGRALMPPVRAETATPAEDAPPASLHPRAIMRPPAYYTMYYLASGTKIMRGRANEKEKTDRPGFP